MRSMACFDLKKFFSNWRGVLLLLGGLVVLGLVGWALWCIPPLLVEQVVGRLDKPDTYHIAKLEDEYRRTLVQSIGGFFLLVGLYLGWLRVKAAQENVRVAEEGQITERFTRAIAQLGDDNMAIRLGGIYALERISKDSEKDHRPIMEVLTAYVREKATNHGKYVEEAAEKPTTDIQAILTVIGRRKAADIERFDDILDLSNTRLVGANLQMANLSMTDLGGAALNDAYLEWANLSWAKLEGADLNDAHLEWANLSKAYLSGAKNLTAKQVRSAKNWLEAYPPDYLKDLPEPPA